MIVFHRDLRRPMACRMYAEGKSVRAISRYFGVDHKTISNDLAGRVVEVRDNGPKLSHAATARVVELINAEMERLSKNGATPPGRRSQQASTTGRVTLADPPLPGAATAIATQVGCSVRQLLRVRNEVKQMTLGVADRFVTRLFGPQLWHVDPVLAEWYEA